MGRKILHGTGRAQVELSGDAWAPLERLLDTVGPATSQILKDGVDQLYADAHEKWPVKMMTTRERNLLDSTGTPGHLKGFISRQIRRRPKEGIGGYSKGKLEHGFRIEGDMLIAFVRNTAPYAWYIKDAYTQLRTANELIYKPGRKLGRVLVKTMSDELGKLARGE